MATRTKAVAAAKRPAEPAPAEKQNLLRAGLKALGNVRDDVVQQQSRVFEALLGSEPARAWSGLVKGDGQAAAKLAQEALGLRKFEAVFDQRVAGALEHLGMPAAEMLHGLIDEVAALRAEVKALNAEVAALRGAPPRAASAKTSAAKSPPAKTARQRKA